MKPMRYSDIIKKVKKAGFAFRRATGSHEIWWNFKTQKTCVVPHHIEVAPGTLKNIINQMGIDKREFDKL